MLQLEEPDRDGSDYIRQFGWHQAWNDLYPVEGWQPQRLEAVEWSEKVQRAHLGAFFAARYRLRHPVPPLLALDRTMALVRDSISRLSEGSLWYRLQLHLKVRIILRRRLQRMAQRRREARDAVLAGWLQYWQVAEGKVRAAHRDQVSPSAAPRAPPQSLPLALTVVPDCVKAQVLWELYWLLQAQLNRALTRYWTRWFGLLEHRRGLRVPLAPTDDPALLQTRAEALAKTDAALFVAALQQPRMLAEPGRDLRHAELVRLTLAPNIFSDGAVAPELRHVSPTLVAFLTSDLCHDA
eukprot:EG_transcript_20157